ncbi:DUF58 domain-containing protein [Sediminibacterium sp.]|uniref:DUF58 domain-containing protein n=1 Tax=Sediminibacterium sp. TaxID=1917865 RepID=UPI002735D03A|nr:DUF58 domain-containing protein [Sediminibacterium sp.]MDP3567281.1 DUF58 domain-containing protein [Sediminibacterium sp.]
MLNKFSKIFKQIRLTKWFYRAVFSLILLFILSFLFEVVYDIAFVLLVLLIFVAGIDIFILFRNKHPLSALRKSKYERLSNGDLNEVELQLQSFYSFTVNISIVDELPFQFQIRNFKIDTVINKAEAKSFSFQLRPVERGEYQFGLINLFVRSPIYLIERHIKIENNFMMKCYPSFLKLRQFELLAISNRLSELGVKKIRRIGHSTEFEQIKEYVNGDDVRTINWKATARRSQLMINHYRDERAQQVYCLVDMGRIMKMPFDELTLLDYAINASLVLGHVAWIKQDKPGLIGFSNKINVAVNADRKGNQLLRLQEGLYNAKTNFEETNYENLLSYTRAKITQRSLLLLFTNFETLSGLKRQLKYIRKMATQHLVVVIFFENTELKEVLAQKPKNTFQIYEQTIAQKFDFEKRQITLELQRYGILSVYTTPKQLTVNSLNKYLEIKTRGMI